MVHLSFAKFVNVRPWPAVCPRLWLDLTRHFQVPNAKSYEQSKREARNILNRKLVHNGHVFVIEGICVSYIVVLGCVWWGILVLMLNTTSPMSLEHFQRLSQTCALSTSDDTNIPSLSLFRGKISYYYYYIYSSSSLLYPDRIYFGGALRSTAVP